MIMTYHYFQNIEAQQHLEKMKLGDSVQYISYEPKLSSYVYAGRINFDTTEEFGVEYPDSLWDCLFAIGLDSHYNPDYASVEFIQSENNLSRSMYPTDILLLDNIAWMYATNSSLDRFGCNLPFEFLQIDLKSIIDKVKEMQ